MAIKVTVRRLLSFTYNLPDRLCLYNLVISQLPVVDKSVIIAVILFPNVPRRSTA
jgi:hypothetical protein